MKLEFESNISVVDSAENDSPKQNGFADKEAAKMFEAGVKLAQEGRSAEARNLLLRATEAEPENESAWLWLASISEYPEELLVFLNNVLKINPNNERAVEWAKATKSLLSKTFVQRGIDASKDLQKDFARQCFLQAVVHDNQNETAWLWLASISETEEEKTAYLEKVLEISPENKTARFSLKSLKTQKDEAILKDAVKSAVTGDYESAFARLREIPEHEEGWVLKAYLVRSFDEKLKCYERILELNPENDMAQANLIALLSLMEKAETGEEIVALPQVESNQISFESLEFSTEESEPDANLSVEQENTDFTSVVENQDETEAALDERPTQKFQLEEDFSQPENESAEEVTDNFEESETAFDAPELAEVQSDSPQAEDVSAEFPMEAAENEIENPVSDLEYQTEEVVEFEHSELAADEGYEETQAEIYAQTAEVTGYFDAADESNEEMEDEGVQFDFEDDYSGDSPAETSKFDDSPGVYEIETDDLPLPEELKFDENEQNFSEENNSLAESDSQPIENFESQAADDFSENDASEPQVETHKSQIKVKCPFCSIENEAQAFACHSCRAVLSLSDLDMILAHSEADTEMVGNSVKKMENRRSEREFTAEELKFLGIGYLNLKNSNDALDCLKKAVHLNPDDVVFSSQVNALALLLADLERQESHHHAMPQNRTIMVVDDSATVRKLITGKLEKSGHQVISAADGIDALEKLQDTVPDLILLDINMPRMDGYQVCKLIRTNEATKDVPVVMISGKDGFFDKVRGRMAGTTGYITKPFGPETLMRTIEAYVTQTVE